MPLPGGADPATAARLEAHTAGNGDNEAQPTPDDPLYLFGCSLLWREKADTNAGWELIHGLKSEDREVRAIARVLLAKAQNVRLPAASEPGLEVATGVPSSVAADINRNPVEVVGMNTPYGLEIIDSCLHCKMRIESCFCNLSPEMLKSFSAASHQATYPGGALLFLEGQKPRGAFVLCSGKVKLSTTSREGKVLILKIAQPGEALGLSAAISGTSYELTAETTGPCQVTFVERETFIKLVEKNGELGLRAAQALSHEFQSAYRDIQELVLARSSAGKLARLLLSWTGGRENGGSEIRLRTSLTHEEMAQMIGASRETVTRVLSDLRKKDWIRLDGSTLVIRNKTALESLAA